MLEAAIKPLRRSTLAINSIAVGASLRADRLIAKRVARLGGLHATTQARLWPPLTGWELKRHEFVAFCPRCCIEDLSQDRTPYGRRLWQQAYCTVCTVHHLPLLLRRRVQLERWTRWQLDKDVSAAYANSYCHFTGAKREPWVHYYFIYALTELQRAAARAVSGIRPPRRQWGHISCKDFLEVLRDVTNWGLDHFDCVPAWSVAEDLSPIERSEGQKLVGRHRRSVSDSLAGRNDTPSLIAISDPAVRGSALWLAHALMASYHQDASDRQTGVRPQARQTRRLSGLPLAARHSLSLRMQSRASNCWGCAMHDRRRTVRLPIIGSPFNRYHAGLLYRPPGNRCSHTPRLCRLRTAKV
jgi:TniQ protein